MILLQKRAHLILKAPLAVVRLLPVDVLSKSAKIGRTDGEQAISALPREVRNALLLHPRGRPGFDLRYELRGRPGRCQSHRKMNVIGNSTRSKTLAIQSASCSSEIRVERCTDIIIDERSAMSCAENNMDQVEAQRLGHGWNYMPGLQPFPFLADRYLGLRPRLVCRRTYGPQFAGRTEAYGLSRATTATTAKRL